MHDDLSLVDLQRAAGSLLYYPKPGDCVGAFSNSIDYVLLELNHILENAGKNTGQLTSKSNKYAK